MTKCIRCKENDATDTFTYGVEGMTVTGPTCERCKEFVLERFVEDIIFEGTHPVLCSGCHDIFHIREKSPYTTFTCPRCYAIATTKVCLSCGKGKPKKLQWGLCDKCFKAPVEEE